VFKSGGADNKLNHFVSLPRFVPVDNFGFKSPPALNTNVGSNARGRKQNKLSKIFSETLMIRSISVLFIFLSIKSFGQATVQDYGFQQLQIVFQSDTVDILLKIKAGDESKKKPLFLFCQGSLPRPLIIFDKDGHFGVFPFNPDIITNNYHLVIIGKPSIPILLDKAYLNEDFCYTTSSGEFPAKYIEKDNLDFYVKRNIEVLRFLQNQSFVLKGRLVIAGHSEGSSIVAKLGREFKQATHLIYSGGNPLGRIMSIIEGNRKTANDSERQAENQIDYWKAIIDKKVIDNTTLSFSFPPPIDFLKGIDKPTYVCYGTNDRDVNANDYMRIEFIRQKKTNFIFKAYLGKEHNYFNVDKNGEVNYEINNWDKVAADWIEWLRLN